LPALQIVKGYQRKRQTLFEILLIATMTGIFGNIVADIIISSLGFLERGLVAVVGMIAVVLVFLYIDSRYAPHLPAIVSVGLDYHDLLESYEGGLRDAVEYLMTGAGLQEFEDRAKPILERTVQRLEQFPFRGKITDLQTGVRRLGDQIQEVTISGRLDGISNIFRLKGVRAKLELIIWAGTVEYDPERVTRVNLRIIFTIENPEHPLADDFVTQVIEPCMPRLAEIYSHAFRDKLPIHKIMMLRLFLGICREIRKDDMADNWYLMDYYPYDGISENILVIDKSLINRKLHHSGPFGDPVWGALSDTELWGAYVTDSDEWPPADSRSRSSPLLEILPHIIEEARSVNPSRIITIGKKARLYLDRHISDLPANVKVVPLFENLTEVAQPYRFREELSRELARVSLLENDSQ
jgi:hypothetical protein